MSADVEAKKKELARFESELKDLEQTLPEHCSGTKDYICAHRATPKHWEQIEDIEERIKQLKAELRES